MTPARGLPRFRARDLPHAPLAPPRARALPEPRRGPAASAMEAFLESPLGRGYGGGAGAVREEPQLALRQFLSARTEERQRQLEELPAPPAGLGPRCAVCGPPRSGKTSLLFHYALRVAEAGETVLFVAARDKITRQPPLLPAGVSIEDARLERIKMKYLATRRDLLTVLSGIHMLEEAPGAIVIDDLHAYLGEGGGGEGGRKALVQLLGYLHEASEFLSSKAERGACKVVLSYLRGGEAMQTFFTIQRWIPLIYRVEPDGGCYRLEVHANDETKEHLIAGAQVQYLIGDESLEVVQAYWARRRSSGVFHRSPH